MRGKVFKAKGLLTILLFATAFMSLAAAVYADTDVTSMVKVTYSNAVYDRVRKTTSYDVTLTNISQQALLTPIKVVIDGISTSAVTITNADGTMEDGKLYFDYSGRISGGTLCPNEVSLSKTWIFSNPNRVRFTPNLKVMGTVAEAFATIGPEGGVVEVTDSNSPIFGTKLVVPADTLDNVATITITYADELPSPLNDESVVASKVIVLNKDGDSKFNQPVQITIPYIDNNMAEGDVPVIFYWDSISGKYHAVEVTEVNSVDKTITFKTIHFTPFVGVFIRVAELLGLVSLEPVDTGFRPDTDGFFYDNFGSGKCAGMAAYSKWYFDYKKAQNGDGLYHKYRDGVQNDWKDDIVARELIIRAHSKIDQVYTFWSYVREFLKDDGITGLTLIESMRIEKSPQLITFRSYFLNTAHAVLVYKYESGRFYIYDNSYPGKIVTLDWSPDAGFSNYTIHTEEGEQHYSWEFYNEYALLYLSSIVDVSEFEDIYEGAKAGWPISLFPKINITSPVLDVNDSATVLSEYDVTITGTVTVPDGVATPPTLFYSVNGGTDNIVTINGNSFNFTIPHLYQPTNYVTLFTAEITNNGKEYTGCKEIILNGGNQPPSAPELIEPYNGQANVNPNDIEFKWGESVDPENNSIEYCVTINEDSSPEDIPIHRGCDNGEFLQGTSLSFVNPILEPGKTYWWAVWAKDENSNWSEASEWWIFTTGDSEPIDSGEWIKRYGGSSKEAIYSIQQTADGNFIAAGHTYSFGAGSSDAWVLKLNSDGSIAWQKTYGQRDYNRIYSIQQTFDGGYIAAGDMYGLGWSSSDAWVLKLNSDGGIAWQKTYGGDNVCGSATDEIKSIQQTADGGYIAAGYTYSFGAGSSDAWILKLNPDGNIAWEKSYGWSRSDHVASIKETADGGYIAAGDTNSFGESYLDYDSWLLKLHSDGSIAWQKIYGKHGVSDDEYIYSVQQTTGEGYVAAGMRGDSRDAWILKANSSGEIPGCSAVAESHAIVSDTSAIIEITSLVPEVSSAISADTSVTPQETAAQITEVCTAP